MDAEAQGWTRLFDTASPAETKALIAKAIKHGQIAAALVGLLRATA